MKGEAIVILSSDDWGWKTSKYQLATRFAKENRVLFVSSVGFRAPTASRQDLGRILLKLRKFFKGVEEVSPALHVLTPLVIPFKLHRLEERVNAMLLRFQLGAAMRRLDIREPYLFVFSQNWLDLAKSLRRKKTIYYCIDEFTGFKGIDRESFQEKDVAMTRLADLVICSSRTLQARRLQHNSRTYYLCHGVDHALFSAPLHDAAIAIPEDVASLPRPLIGFFGHISYDWVDVELVKRLAAARPQWSVVLIGRYSLAPDEFAGFGNIAVLGERDYRELPRYCKAFSVGIIPFVASTLTRNCNPLKVYEYLSAGLPVVATDIPEVRALGELVHVASSAEEFLRLCDLAVAETGPERQRVRSEAMARHSWDERVKEVYRLIGTDS